MSLVDRVEWIETKTILIKRRISLKNSKEIEIREICFVDHLIEVTR